MKPVGGKPMSKFGSLLAISIAAGLCAALEFAPAAFAQAQSCSANLDGSTYTATGRVTMFGQDDTPFGPAGELILLDNNTGCRIAVAFSGESSNAPVCAVGKSATVTGRLTRVGGDATAEDDYLLDYDTTGAGWSCR